MEIYKNTSIEDLENEIWVKTQEYDYDYCFSNMGRIKLGDKIVKQYLDKDLYCLCHLKTNGKMKLFRVHRIIAKYYIENKENKPQIKHINSNQKDNRIENLEWSTQKENIRHAMDKLNFVPFKNVIIDYKKLSKLSLNNAQICC
jgi:hypothetical protein